MKTLSERTDQTRLAGLEREVELLKRRPPGDVTWEIKIHSDSSLNDLATGNGVFIHLVSEDMDGLDLVECECYVTTVGSTVTRLQIRNVMTGDDLLSTRMEIDANEKNSMDAAVQPVVNRANSLVSHGDHIAIDIDNIGAGSRGLGCVLTFRQVR